MPASVILVIMKILIAPDKFKGSLGARQVSDAIERGLLSRSGDYLIRKQAMADGGEGSMDLIDRLGDAEVHELIVSDPLFRPIKASYLIRGKTAYIEMSAASGLGLLTEEELDCTKTSSYGTGELIRDAIYQDVEELVLFIGGSATNDLGIGMATALGYRFLNTQGFEVLPTGASLGLIRAIQQGTESSALRDIEISVVSDVDNILYGHYGAAYMYARQKGASAKDLLLLDNGLRSLSDVIRRDLNQDIAELPGSGAAGGMGGGAVAFLGANLISGSDYFIRLLGLELMIQDADIVITGEGQLDTQSLSGKVVGAINRHCIESNTKCIALCGQIDLPVGENVAMEIHSLMSKARSQKDAMDNAAHYLEVIASEMELNPTAR